jgi:SAM-dependent methyltransferase
MSGNAIRCVGLDPLDRKESGFDFICGVGESLPFGSSTFDHCVSGTTLDHCVRPDVVLKEMRRVTKESGKISLWIGCWAQDGTFDQPKTRTQSLPNVQEQSAVSRGLAQDAKDAWIILMRGDFPFLLKAIQIRLARVTRSLRLLIPHRLSARSDPYHLHHFREKDIDAMLRSAGLFVLKEKKLPDGSLFLTASVNTV